TIAYIGIIRSRYRRLHDFSIKKLLEEQIITKEAQLKEAKSKLAEMQNQLKQEVTVSEQTQRLAEERKNAILTLEKELRDLQAYSVREDQPPKIHFAEIVHANTSKMADVLELVAKVSSDDIPVLILGETGTGKEMIARAIHQTSKRRNTPFVAINCGALPETLLDSELFGHEKGSFTGAQSRRRGRFELANGGTIFLDEITETTQAFQARLLRVLQDGTFERVGGEQTIKVDVRLIAATNKDLQTEMEEERFRSDLFYRLNGFPITLPPLRERMADIPLLAVHFLKKHGYHLVSAFSGRAMEILQIHHWPGNVRELENIVRRAAIMAQSEERDIIKENDLPEELSLQQTQTVYKPLELQILDMLRLVKFSRSAISQTAEALGNRDRGTITEYFRGICFEHLVKADFNIEDAAKDIAATTDEQIIKKVQAKINEYLSNLRTLSISPDETMDNEEKLPSPFKGLPKKYHPFLKQVIEYLHKD
ncbi:MAG: sigma-54-dependent Fis family transcriptional regulator, partial [bacterium]